MPVGEAAPVGPVTVAVKVTGWPKVDGFPDEERVIAVLAFATFRLKLRVTVVPTGWVASVTTTVGAYEPASEGVPVMKPPLTFRPAGSPSLVKE